MPASVARHAIAGRKFYNRQQLARPKSLCYDKRINNLKIYRVQEED
jgi:hypothetical protein